MGIKNTERLVGILREWICKYTTQANREISSNRGPNFDGEKVEWGCLHERRSSVTSESLSRGVGEK